MMNRLICALFGHKWDRQFVTLACGFGCSDSLWECERCHQTARTPFFRNWSCTEHQAVAEDV
jgi:hypothetical protein